MSGASKHEHPAYNALCVNVENYTHNQETARPLLASNEWLRQCRMSLRSVLKTLQHEQKTSSPTNEYIPPDMPIHAVNWATKSSTEQQITLLIICMRSAHVSSKHVFITSLFGNVVTLDIDEYVVNTIVSKA